MKNSILYYLAGIIWPTTYLALFVGLMMQEWLPFLLAVHFAGQGMMVYATIRPNCGWFGPVVRSFQTDRREIWLTIDDGPNPETTPAILKLLKGYNARATFFVVGKNVRQHPDLARLIVAHGHTLGNHSESHPSAHFWSLLKGSVAREVDKCNAVVQKAAGESPAFFRAPVGMANPFVHRVVRERKMLLVGWTSRGFDSARKNAQRIVNALVSCCAC